jgi:predicted O-methyltransferase YrrM
MLQTLRNLFKQQDPDKARFQNADTALTLAETSVERRFDCEYRKTYDFPGQYIDDAHRSIGEAPLHEWGMIDIGIEGWLLPADASKLYELAYFAGGDVLELGTYKGLSTAVLARAVFESGRNSSILTVDLNASSSIDGSANLDRLKIDGRERVRFLTADAIQFVAELGRMGRKYSFAFVDHSHRYEHMRETCHVLHQIMEPGSFVLFHDYNDPRNADESNEDYGVYQGVHEGLKPGAFEFWGIYGCTGLFRRTSMA